jgi:membrane-bound ClpP family serine protease
MSKKISSPEKHPDRANLAFGKLNYILIGVAFALIILGFILMTGGETSEVNGFNPDIFSTRRIVIAPTVCLAGFMFMIYAILKNTKKNSSEGSEN